METMTETGPAETDHQQARREIIRRYGRLTEGGLPKFCHPRKDEIDAKVAAGKPAPRAGQVIYDSVELARAAARDMQELDGIRQVAYECHRSRHGHAHLRARRPGEPPA